VPSPEEMFNEAFGPNGHSSLPDGLDPQAAMTILMAMPGLAGQQRIIKGDNVTFHDSPQIVLPKGMTYDELIKTFQRLKKDGETVIELNPRFLYRPDDGAVAAATVLKERYGIVFGEATNMGPFGQIPARTRQVKTGPDETVYVPWGELSIPSLPGVELQFCDRHPHPDYGNVFEIHVSAPKRYKEELEELFAAIEAYLQEHSIYRGRALTGAKDLTFLDLSRFDPRQIVFSDMVETLLAGLVYGPLRFTDTFRQDGLPLKRTILLYGPYGTGKTSVGMIAGQIAVANGWTFLEAKPGEDEIQDALRTAKLYGRAVVLIEDVDANGSLADEKAVSRLLAMFDGVSAKGTDLIVIMTTNHVEDIHQGMLRPGRIDGVIPIAELDLNGVTRLIQAVMPPEQLDPAVDFAAVHQKMEGFLPAFVREVVDRARAFAIVRQGSREYVLTTADLVAAADSLRPQFELLEKARRGVEEPSLDRALKMAVKAASQTAVHGAEVGYDGVISVPELNGATHD
jgi:transitional endoplasmic reticulum ATPase